MPSRQPHRTSRIGRPLVFIGLALIATVGAAGLTFGAVDTTPPNPTGPPSPVGPRLSTTATASYRVQSPLRDLTLIATATAATVIKAQHQVGNTVSAALKKRPTGIKVATRDYRVWPVHRPKSHTIWHARETLAIRGAGRTALLQAADAMGNAGLAIQHLDYYQPL